LLKQSYEDFLKDFCGVPSGSPSNVPEEYYWMILTGESPPNDYSKLPRRPLGYYLATLAGVDFNPRLSLEAYWCLLVDGFIPNPLPNRSLGHYVGTYVPSGFRVRTNAQGALIIFGGEPLPNFILNENTGILTYFDTEPNSPLISQVSLNANGFLLLDE